MPDRVPNGSEPFPSQRPPSPEMKLSPTETIAVVAEPGLATARASPSAPSRTAVASTVAIALLIPSPSA